MSRQGVAPRPRVVRRRPPALPTMRFVERPPQFTALLARIRRSQDRAVIGELLTITSKSTADMTRRERRRARELAGLSVRQVARYLAIPENTIDLLELWPAAAPSADLARRLDRLYGLSPRKHKNSRRRPTSVSTPAAVG